MSLWAICCAPVTGEQYVKKFDHRDALEAFIMEEPDRISFIIEGVEVAIDDFIKP